MASLSHGHTILLSSSANITRFTGPSIGISAFRSFVQSLSTRSLTSQFPVNKGVKDRASGHTLRPFVNIKQLTVQGGNGGDGCIAFERLFCNPKAGPSGGDGGNGGHIILQASQDTSDLSHLASVVRGANGSRGGGSNCHGANGAHVYLKVPIGTQIFLPGDADDGVSISGGKKRLLGTVPNDGDLFIAARGGAGGKGNAFLTNSAFATISARSPLCDRNTPLRLAERGAKGECRRILLRMAQLAQLGLVGAPNAGKSTLLRRLTRARPKVAPYAFTTLRPHMGILKTQGNEENTDDGQNQSHSTIPITIADLPGLIDGAAEHNRGLGAQFLSLIADCRLLAFVIDIGTTWSLLDLGRRHSDWRDTLTEEVVRQLTMLSHELTTFDHKMVNPGRCMVVGTKLDLVFPRMFETMIQTPSDNDSLRIWNSIVDVVSNAARDVGILEKNNPDKVILVSARRADNIDELVRRIHRQISMFEADRSS
ncbi:unnamed protein product [Calicophoron daubneyi]|uniref:Uncharacterized protein n=1 Tax=Calicophoron daubneyi TaxID=300641 RepID=A0AAV2TI59_CALDB